MASETVDPIDWSHPPPYTGQYPMSSTYCTLQCGLQITRLAELSQPRTCDFRMPDQRTAGAATQGIIKEGNKSPAVQLGSAVRQCIRVPMCTSGLSNYQSIVPLATRTFILHRQFDTHHVCDTRLAVPEVVTGLRVLNMY